MTKAFFQGVGGGPAFRLQLLEKRGFVHLQAYVDGDDDQYDGDKKGYPPAPVIEFLDAPGRIGVEEVADQEDHSQGHQEPYGGRSLYPGSKIASAMFGRMF